MHNTNTSGAAKQNRKEEYEMCLHIIYFYLSL